MEYNKSTKNIPPRFNRSWVLVSVFLFFTFLTLLGYTLMSKFSWTPELDEVPSKATGFTDDQEVWDQGLPWQPSLPGSLTTLNNSKVESILEELTLSQITKLTFAVPGIKNPGIPKVGIKPFTWNLDCSHGNKFSDDYPVSLALAASFSSDLIHKVASAVGRKARSKWESSPESSSQSLFGNVCFAPNVNLMRDPRWSGNEQTLGEDPLVISNLVTSYISGLRGNASGVPRIMAGCRYMSPFSGPEQVEDPFNFDARISRSDLYMTYLRPFKACVEAGTDVIMCTHHKINRIPSCAEYNQLSELRQTWHYRGVIVSDVDSIRNMLTLQKYRHTPQDVASSAIAAGTNFELTSALPGIYQSQMISLSNETITESQLRNNVKPIIYTSMLFDQEKSSTSKRDMKPLLPQEERSLRIKALLKTFVLLKNDGSLPLQKKYRKLAIIGPAGKGLVLTSGNSTKLPGLSYLANGWIYISGCQESGCKKHNLSSSMASIAEADLVFLTLSSGVNFTTKLDYSPNVSTRVNQLLKMVVQNVRNNTKIILLLFMASPVDISWAQDDPRVSAILECFKPVAETSTALYQTLVNNKRNSSPGGRLPFTWYPSLKNYPKPTEYSMKNRTYRFNTGEPLYPFGFGMSYTTFRYSGLEVPKRIPSFNPLPLSFTLTNIGKFDADEVVQIYMKWQSSHVQQVPRIQLVYFKRVALKSGRSLNFKWKIPYDNFSVWTGHKQGYTTLPGTMTLFVGGQQPGQKRKLESNVLSSRFQVIMTQRQPGF